MGALAIVKNGKPFTDGEYAKNLMLDVANELFDDFPNKTRLSKELDMPLSARTVHDRTIFHGKSSGGDTNKGHKYK